MPFLMEIGFDNNCRLQRRHYLFEYKGIQFKLIQDNPRKWSDHLLTILPHRNEAERQRVFSAASEFVSALGWQNNARMTLWEMGGSGWHNERSLSQARPRIRTFPKIPFGGSVVGYNIDVIPQIETEAQRIALILYREASASNNDYLSFLFYWQILDTGGTNAEDFVNNIHHKKPKEFRWDAEDITQLPLNGQKLGFFLRDEFRHAIAHIRRQSGRRKLEMDKIAERHRISNAVRIVKRIGEYYIREHLKLKKQLHLKRKGKSGFPAFVSTFDSFSQGWVTAYPSKYSLD